jgi:hypothetical protein
VVTRSARCCATTVANTGCLPLTRMPLLTALAARSPFAAAYRDSDSGGAGGTPSVPAELAALAPRSGQIACGGRLPTG